MMESGNLKSRDGIEEPLESQLIFEVHSEPKPLHILVAGPYRSGTGDNPERIEQNVRFMNEIALQLYDAGHMPVLGEWYALPLIATAGSTHIGDDTFNRIFHSSSVRLLDHCDAVVRVGGPSSGADMMVEAAREKGLLLFECVEDIPRL